MKNTHQDTAAKTANEDMAAKAVHSKPRPRRDGNVRWWATGALAASFVLYAVAVHFQLPWVKAFAEAALIGGLADWFAVTALFRRPLGLPIPHTALIPRNRDRLGAALGRFVCDNFLSPDLIGQKILHWSPAARLAEGLSDAAQVERLLRRLRPALAGLDWGIVLRFIQPGPPLAAVLRAAQAEGLHDRAVLGGIQAACALVQQERDVLAEKIGSSGGKWVPAWIDRKLADLVVQALQSWLQDLGRPDHPRRLDFARRLSGLAERLESDPQMHRKLASLRDDLADPMVKAWWDGQGGEQALIALIQTQARALAADPERMARLDRMAVRAVERLIVPNRDDIADFIAAAVRRWDDAELTAKLEARIGDDLQYIRINGAVVGGLAGLALHALSSALG